MALPSSVQLEDSNQLALIYFCLHGLALIKKLELSEVEKDYYINCILRYSIGNGFRQTIYYRKIPGDYDLPAISATFFALASLKLLGYDLGKLDTTSIMKFLIDCQSTTGESYLNSGKTTSSTRLNYPKIDGTRTTENNTINQQPSFDAVPHLNSPLGGFGEFSDDDLRITYMALGVRRLLSINSDNTNPDINTELARSYIFARLNYQGGFSSDINTESHLGYTFCALASLKMLNTDLSNFDKTISWLVHRQGESGAYNGRENKLGDTCYSWWCTGSLSILGSLEFTNLDKAREFLLETAQSKLTGGFSKDGEANPDPFHSFLALASLALWNKTSVERVDLADIDELLVIARH